MHDQSLANVRLHKRGIFPRGIRKYVIAVFDDVFECVLRPREDGMTFSFSSQVGCAVGCTFCATGRQGFSRNLSCKEMLEAIRLVSEDAGVVPVRFEASAQGEPFKNSHEVMKALAQLACHGDISVSTCGIPSEIEAFAKWAARQDLTPSLWVTINSAVQDQRSILMPGTVCWPLSDLRDALLKTRSAFRSLALSYAVREGFNDSVQHIELLQQFCLGLSCRVYTHSMDDGYNGPRGSMPDVARRFADACILRGIDACCLPEEPKSPISIKYYPKGRES